MNAPTISLHRPFHNAQASRSQVTSTRSSESSMRLAPPTKTAYPFFADEETNIQYSSSSAAVNKSHDSLCTVLTNTSSLNAQASRTRSMPRASSKINRAYNKASYNDLEVHRDNKAYGDISARLAAVVSGAESYAEIADVSPTLFSRLYEQESFWEKLQYVLTTNCPNQY